MVPLSGASMTRPFLSLLDYTSEELEGLLDLARQMKLCPEAFRTACSGQTLAMIFQKPSLRTRVSFEVGIGELGGHGIYLGPTDIQLHRGETIADTARVLSRYADGIMARVFAHADVVALAENASVPVINGLSDLLHPCQVLADLLTIREKKGRLEGLTLAFVGDGNNMAHSLLNGGARFGMHVRVSHPAGYAPDVDVVAAARQAAAATGGSIHLTTDPREGVEGADVVYTDVWASMGQEKEAAERLARFRGFQVDAALMRLARPDAVFLHCLPAHRGEEVTGEVIDGPASVVFDEAENRLHAQKAIMARLMGSARARGPAW
ncbi:MAG: ornithine carbamoyltransferase [Deltaproteobacteria bacterium]|nr:ornithine carbamoyltransferase [Deltaproteobacteria bacterium]